MKKENNQYGIKRKCKYCGEYLYINKNNINEAIYYDKTTYHSRCFINLCNEKMSNKRKNVIKKWTWIYDNLDRFKADTYSHFCNEIEKEDVYQFIRDSYDLTTIPTTVWQKLSNIYSGTFKGMSTGIPPADLLDMWKRKIDMLNGIATKNESKGIRMQPDQRLNYDLTILVNKYDSYLKWKEKQKILAVEEETEKMQNIVSQAIDYTKINREKVEDNSDDNDDITNLVDDIFG